MGCGCAKRMSKSRRKKQAIKNKKGSIIRKRRVSRLIAVPGTTSRRKAVEAEPTEPTETTEET
jgi:hypothetical protein